MAVWQTTRFPIDLSTPKIMGIVNVTPDSFSDGGRYNQNVQAACAHAEQLLRDGADILDIGGESTRPGSAPVSPEDEWQRVRGYIDIVNDVQALEDEGAVALLAQSADTGICLMHMKGRPHNMQSHAQYRDTVAEVKQYLRERTEICTQAGIKRERIVWDLGFGFAKDLPHNLQLMRHLREFADEYPVLVGVSRKRMIGEMTGRTDPMERVSGSVAAALFAYTQGAAILRVHDVRETADALKVWQTLTPAA